MKFRRSVENFDKIIKKINEILRNSRRNLMEFFMRIWWLSICEIFKYLPSFLEMLNENFKAFLKKHWKRLGNFEKIFEEDFWKFQ